MDTVGKMNIFKEDTDCAGKENKEGCKLRPSQGVAKSSSSRNHRKVKIHTHRKAMPSSSM